MSVRILCGDARAMLRTLPERSVHMCVTSPPYFGLRDYGVDGQIGLEDTPDEYVAVIVDVFREVWRVLRDDGTLWLNLGDSYAGSWGAQGKRVVPGEISRNSVLNHPKRARQTGTIRQAGLKPKDLIGIPWMVAFALRADGWYLRKEIIWSKPNPMPESVTDRPTSAHEHVFLLSKRERYFYDADAVRQALTESSIARLGQDVDSQAGSARANGGRKTNGPMKAVRFGGDKGQGDHGSGSRRASGNEWEGAPGANLRDVLTIATRGFKEAHYATFPPDLPERCIKAGTSERGVCPHCGAPWVRQADKRLVPTAKAAKRNIVDDRDRTADRSDQGSNRQKDGHVPGWRRADVTRGWVPTCACPAHDPVPATVLDPFFGAGTTGLVANRLRRDCIGIELKPSDVDMARRRIERDAGLFAEVAAE